MSRSILAVDTSGSFCSVALVRAGATDGLVWQESSSGDGDHFEQLPSLVSRVLSTAAISPREIGEVRIGVGPGSFTGIRIGMSFAKGIAWSLGVPLKGGSSFLACVEGFLSTHGHEGDGRFGVVSDARRGEVFLGVYGVSAGVVTTLVEPCIVPIGVVGKHAAGVERWLSPERDFQLPDARVRVESGIAIGLLRLTALAGDDGIAGVAAVEPSYVREVAAKTIAERSKVT